MDPTKVGLKAIGFGSEPYTEEIRQRIQETFNAPAYNIYGLTEIMGPGVALPKTAFILQKITSILKS